MLLNGKDLKVCSDSELVAAYPDVIKTPHDLADAILVEMDLRRAMRAASSFPYPPTPEI